MDDKNADGDFEASAFEALERDFQEILQELVGDKSLEHFRQEYEKLHRALKKSHESEKHLIKKCRELNTEIVQNAVKVQTALKLSQEDKQTITALKREIERAWKMVETSHEKEQRAKETIQNLKSEISKLGRLVEQGAGLSINQENMVNHLVQEKNDLIKYRDMLQGQVVQLQQQNTDLNGKVSNLESERSAGNSELHALRAELEALLTEAEAQQQRKDKLDRELKELRQIMEARQNEINAKRQESTRNAEQIEWFQQQIQDEQNEVERLKSEQDKLEVRKDHERRVHLEGLQQKQKLTDDNADHRAQLQHREDEIDELRHHKEKLVKAHEILSKKKDTGDQETKRLEESKNYLKTEIAALSKELEKLRKDSDADTKMITDLLHERNLLHKNVLKGDEKTKVQAELVQRHKAQTGSLKKDLQRWKVEREMQLGRIHELDKQREKYASELGIAEGRYKEACEELRKKDNYMARLKQGISQIRTKLGQQKNLYEAVRTDKNLYSKNLAESTEEISEMRKKFKVMHHQIQQLQEEIKEKEKVINTQHFELQSKSKDTERTKEILVKHFNNQKKAQQTVETNQQSIKKLEVDIRELEIEQQNQRKDFEAVTSERNILGTQLIRRNDELALLYEKIKIQESTLKKGEIQYKGRMDIIKKQKDDVSALAIELAEVQQQADQVKHYQKEIYHLQRELLQERTKVKALAEELENPMNVHRWRKLEGSDPQMYELIQKVRTLQKRLIAKTEEVVRKDFEIQEKDRMHKDLQNILEKQPGPEVLEQLEMYQETHGEKLQQMQAMQSELQTYQAQVGDYKDEIDRLTRELQEVKKKYFEQKRREQIAQEAQRGDTRAIHPKHVPATRFTGGGFNLAH
mmetsp:Transcript_55474/g.121399  ORF Transcript_55474/g.121399 Transcript_55474/m.121399 type:complete len:866 (-) Transcript_55474:47-2644(-)